MITGAQATGIEFADNRAVTVRAKVGEPTGGYAASREVILCAGVVGSPHILMLSGFGPADHLKAMDVEPKIDLPGAEQNLQKHIQVPLLYACTQPITLYQPIRIGRAALALFRAAAFRSGPFAHFPVQGGPFTRSLPRVDVPDTQWHFGTALGVRRVRLPF